MLCAAAGVCGAQQQDPKADPAAVVAAGHARFTVLTSKLIRMEWSADGVFEDRASFVFLNRKMAVPKSTRKITFAGKNPEYTIATDALRVEYRPALASDGRFTADSLTVSFTLDGKPVTW